VILVLIELKLSVCPFFKSTSYSINYRSAIKPLAYISINYDCRVLMNTVITQMRAFSRITLNDTNIIICLSRLDAHGLMQCVWRSEMK